MGVYTICGEVSTQFVEKARWSRVHVGVYTTCGEADYIILWRQRRVEHGKGAPWLHKLW